MVQRSFWLLVVSFITFLCACFDPQLKDGQLTCGANQSCPPGYKCYGGACYAGTPPTDAPAGYALTVTASGDGTGTVTSVPAGIDCGTTCTKNFTVGTAVTLTAAPSASSTFVGWSGACSGTSTCTVTVNQAVNVTANFALQNTLIVALAGTGSGFVTSSPAGINCGSDCMESYTPGTMVTLTALAITGSTFDGWSGGGCMGNSTCTVTLDAAKMVTATFTLNQYALTVSPAGNGAGTVTSTPAGINCGTDCNEAYNYNTVVTLTAVPSTGSTFTGWSGGGCSGTGTCVVTMTAATNVIPTFTLQQNALTVAEAGNGAGTVTAAPAGITCPGTCSHMYDYNTTVTLSATPATGSVFTGWAGGGCSGTSACVVSVTAATMVTATFTLTTPTLTVNKSGNGSGQVTSNPAGIDCGTTCNQAFNYGSSVTLTAAPATGSSFTGWSGGGCSGTGTCVVSVTAATSVTATFTLNQFNLTVATNGGTGAGTVTSTPAGINCGANCVAPYNYNQMVTLTAAASAGSTFTGWSGAGCGGTGSCVVTMTAAATVTASFTLQTYQLTVSPTGTGTGTVTGTGINCGSDCNEIFGYGTMVTLTATPTTGSTFGGWTGGGCSGTGTCTVTISQATNVQAQFTLTSQTLTITPSGTGSGSVTSTPAGISCSWNGTTATGTCSFAFPYGTDITLSASANATSSFSPGWSGGGGCTGTGTCLFTITAATGVNAGFLLGTNSMTVAKGGNGSGTVTSVPAGINCGIDCSENYSNGTVVTLTATPATGSNFTGWSGGGCSGTGTCVITIGAAVVVTANFTLQQFAVTTTTGGTGSGSITSAPSGITCPGTCSANYNYGDTITLTATPSGNSTFAGWSGGGCSGTGTCVISNIAAAASVTATFNLIQYSLTVNPAGGNGSGTVTGTNINCGTMCTAAYNSGTMVTLTETPSTGSTFTGWSGGGCSGTGSCVVTMNAAATVTATFTLQTNALTVTYSGPAGGGSVTSSPGTINCPSGSCSQSFNYGTLVTLTATPTLGNVFNGWSGGGCSGTGTCQVTVTAATGVTATFATATYALNVNLAGTGAGNTGGAGTGAVTSSPGTISCGTTCSNTFNYNTPVTLTETVGTGTTFTGWSGACSGTGSTCAVTMTAAKSVTATFTLLQYTLSVNKAGTGLGSVTSAPAGINCGASCSNAYDYSTSVVLTATATYGSTFAGWTGACSGTGTCTVSMTAARSVTATFNAIPPNKVFVTSTTYNGNLGGLAGADAICAARATAGGLTGTFKAWLSSSTVNAKDRLGTATGWVRKDGKPVFDSLTDLITMKISYPIDQDELGGTVPPGQSVITATSTNGLYNNAGGSWGNCSDYTNSTTGNIYSGYADVTDYEWTQYAGAYCMYSTLRIYCFQVDNQAVAKPILTGPVRRAFITAATWAPNQGIASADALCVSEASAASLTGNYQALLATTAGSAISRFSALAADPPWANVNDTLLAPTASALAGTGANLLTNFDAPPNLTANGASYLSGFHWTGAPDLVTVGTATTTCNNWSDNTSTATTKMGRTGHASVAEGWNWGNSTYACNQSNHIVCLQK